MNSLSKGICVPCEAGMPPMNREEIEKYLSEVEDWEVKEDTEIKKKWKFENFAQALEFVNKIGALAEAEGHHPDISFGWGRVKVKLTTHSIGGLSRNDFIMAAKIDDIYSGKQ